MQFSRNKYVCMYLPNATNKISEINTKRAIRLSTQNHFYAVNINWFGETFYDSFQWPVCLQCYRSECGLSSTVWYFFVLLTTLTTIGWWHFHFQAIIIPTIPSARFYARLVYFFPYQKTFVRRFHCVLCFRIHCNAILLFICVFRSHANDHCYQRCPFYHVLFDAIPVCVCLCFFPVHFHSPHCEFGINFEGNKANGNEFSIWHAFFLLSFSWWCDRGWGAD